MSALVGPQDTGHRAGEIMPLALAAVKVYKGGAAAVVIGTGYGTPLVPATKTHQFVGVFGETIDNSSGTAGGLFTQIVRQGCCKFNSSGITAASIEQPAYFSDDNTVTTTPGTTFAGTITAVDAAGGVWVDISQAVREASNAGTNGVVLSGSTDAISPHISANYIFNTAGVDAATLAAPTATVDDFKKILVTSNTANAHTITATGLLQTGGTAVNVATFAAHPGASVWLMAYQGKWNVLAANAITFS